MYARLTIWLAAVAIVHALPSSSIAASQQESADGVPATVVVERSFVFSEPSTQAAVLRLLYPGEMVRVVANIDTEEGIRFAKIVLSPDLFGYVASTRLSDTEPLRASYYRPPRVRREDRPIALSFRLGGETFGGGLAIRYQHFSRLGLTFAAGSLLTSSRQVGLQALTKPSRIRGTVISLGLSSCPMLSNFSPLIEVGLSSVSYDKQLARLEVINLYSNVGGEYIFEDGVFIGATISYMRSLSARVSYELGSARLHDRYVPRFGALDPGDDNVFQAFQPGMFVGYAF